MSNTLYHATGALQNTVTPEQHTTLEQLKAFVLGHPQVGIAPSIDEKSGRVAAHVHGGTAEQERRAVDELAAVYGLAVKYDAFGRYTTFRVPPVYGDDEFPLLDWTPRDPSDVVAYCGPKLPAGSKAVA